MPNDPLHSAEPSIALSALGHGSNVESQGSRCPGKSMTFWGGLLLCEHQKLAKEHPASNRQKFETGIPRSVFSFYWLNGFSHVMESQTSFTQIRKKKGQLLPKKYTALREKP